MKKRNMSGFLGLGVLALGILFYWESNSLDVSHYEIKDSKIKKKVKICQLSDFHNHASQAFQKKVLDQIKKEAPDYIFITGDMVDSRRTDIETTLSFMKKLLDQGPCFYVSGNHEERLKDIEKLHEAYKNLGIQVLTKDSLTLEGGIRLWGLQDPRVLGPGKTPREMEGYFKEKLDKMDWDQERYQILLVHRPNFLDLFSQYPLDLIFSGHLHGGQVRLPVLGPLLSPYGELFPKEAEGMIERNQTREIISRGLGNSSFPLRINNKPEIIFVNLDEKNDIS